MPQAAEYQTRYIWIKNTDPDEWVPAYGATVLVTPGEDSVLTINPGVNAPKPDGENLVFPIRKPQDADVRSGTSRVVFNGPQPIEPGGIGIGTQDFPCRAVAEDLGPIGAYATGAGFNLVADSWFLSKDGLTQFRNMGQDTTVDTGVGDGTSAGGFVGERYQGPVKYLSERSSNPPRIFWVRPDDSLVQVGYTSFSAGVSGGDKVSFTNSPSSASLSSSGDLRNNAEGFGSSYPATRLRGFGGGTFRFQFAGLWVLTVQCRLTTFEKGAEHEGTLLKIVIRNETLDEDTVYYAERRHFVDDTEGYGVEGEQGDEWVCFNAVLHAHSTETLFSITNSSTYPDTIFVEGYMTAVRLGRSTVFGEGI